MDLHHGGSVPPRYDVVVMVASAGGLDALCSVLSVLGLDLPAAVVVQQHPGGTDSALVQILGRRTTMPVAWADDGALLEPGRVLVARPGRRVELLPDASVASIANDDGARALPHDALLTSLARSFGQRAFVLVLSGMGRDAALGAVAVRAAGGTVLAQSVQTAEHTGMPGAVIEAGAVDLVLPLAEIGAVLADLVSGALSPMALQDQEPVSQTHPAGATGRP